VDVRERMRRSTTFSCRAERVALRGAQLDSAGRGRLVLVRGPAGIGKTALLEAAVRAWRRAGVLVIRASSADAADPYGFRCPADAMRDRFEGIGEPRLAARSGCSGGPRPVRVPIARLVLEIGIAVDLICRERQTGLVADDLDGVPAGGDPSGGRADLVIDLPRLPDDAVSSLLTRVCGASPDSAVLPALGPLFGHPGTVLSVLDGLDQAGPPDRGGRRTAR
jgi:hypothetical protein